MVYRTDTKVETIGQADNPIEKIINKYFKKLTLNSPSSLNLTDDVFFDNKKKIVVSTDTYIEGVHFFNSKKPSNFLFKKGGFIF